MEKLGADVGEEQSPGTISIIVSLNFIEKFVYLRSQARKTGIHFSHRTIWAAGKST